MIPKILWKFSGVKSQQLATILCHKRGEVGHRLSLHAGVRCRVRAKASGGADGDCYSELREEDTARRLCENIREEGPATNGTFLQPNLACVASICHDGRSGGGNGVDNACAPCGYPCGDSVYGTYYNYVDAYPLPASVPLLSE
jgi:hypothetical protein